MKLLEAALARALGEPTLRLEQTAVLSGGSVHEARRLITSHGEFFAKWNRAGPGDIFVREAEGLEALRAVGEDLVIPRMIAAARPEGDDPGFLILEYLVPSPEPSPAADERLGRGLAALHRITAPHFGFRDASYCGLTRQDNRESFSWTEFYRDRRLRPLLQSLANRNGLTPGFMQVFERLLQRLPDFLPPAKPSLIHGDLWAGNILQTTRGPGLVDPACAFADPEMEFGITTLFGGLSTRAFAAYEEVCPLPSGWRERNPLYQIYHLLNHAVLFGGSYAEDAYRLAKRFSG